MSHRVQNILSHIQTGDFQAVLDSYNTSLEMCEQLVPILGQLYRKNNVVTTVHGVSLQNLSPTQLLTAHRSASKYMGEEILPSETLAILRALQMLSVGACRVDVGRLALQFRQSDHQRDLPAFLQGAVPESVEFGPTTKPLLDCPQDVVLYGFGRIGRLIARVLLEKTGGGNKLRLRAIVVRQKGKFDCLQKRADLLKRDSVHGPFKGTIDIDVEKRLLIVNGNAVRLIYSQAPGTQDFTQYGIHDAICVDNTGMWRDEAGLSEHLKSPGISRVVLTAPTKDPAVPNIVMGVNHDTLDPDAIIVAAASCTTNAVAPFCSLLLRKGLGITSAHIETVHSFTNDQNLLDNFHRKGRRGRAAPLNMVITETGAAKAVQKAIPALAGKVTGSAIRVPTPDVSLAILSANLEHATTRDEINDMFRDASQRGSLQNCIGYRDSSEIVSSDFIGTVQAGILDAKATQVSGKRARLYVWYDNEYGYTCQVVRLVQLLGGVQHVRFPSDI